MTTSYIREKLAELRKNKKLERAKEVAEREKTEAAKKTKEIASIERIAKKIARISGGKIVEEIKNKPVKEVKIEPKIETQIDTKKVVLKPVKVENKTTKKIKVTRKKKK
mgnify:CR=1 FL=1|tara:strand:+ start:106 stop:432 length:327 start_codon:yes stop_codon:yes gene_type:complete